jgi:hypothetical protein
MKRFLVTGCLVALVAAAGVTSASAAKYKDFGGPLKGNGTMSFSAFKSGHKYTKAGYFTIWQVPMKCGGGTTALGSFDTSSTVNVSSRRKFSYTFHFSTGGTAKVNGKFNRSGSKATGTFKASGVNFSTHSNCTTNGNRKWRAETY